MSASPPTTEIAARKRALRREVRERLRALPASARVEGGVVAAALITRWLVAHDTPGPVALFASRAIEIDNGPLDDALRAAGRVRLLPRIHADTLTFHAVPLDLPARALPKDRFGIPTPTASCPAVPLAAAALVVVPACALDVHGRRLGWGRGYYDRALSSRRQDGVAQGTLALVLDAQLIDEVPVGPADVRVAHLCVPSRGLLDAVA